MLFKTYAFEATNKSANKITTKYIFCGFAFCFINHKFNETIKLPKGGLRTEKTFL